MAVPKFYRVLRGQRGAAAKAKLIERLTNLDPNQDGIGTKPGRPASKILYVNPFNVDLGNELLLQSSALLPAYTVLSAAVGATRVKDALPASTIGLKAKSLKAARISASTGVSPSGVVKTSKLTGLKYLSSGGTAQSCPFGKATPTEDQTEAFAAIKGALAAGFSRVHLIPEQV
jgi:hypothetical protein